MPKGKKKGGVSGPSTISVPFSFLTTAALSAGTGTLALQPANLGEAANIADSWEFYRITALKYRMHVNNQTNSQAVCFLAGANQTAPTTIAQIMEMPDHAFQPGGSVQSVPTEWVHVAPLRLKGQFEWYKSIADGGDVETEIQGSLVWVGTTTELRSTEVRGIVQFKNLVDNAVTLARLREQVRMEILGQVKADPALVYSPTGGSSPGGKVKQPLPRSGGGAYSP